MGETLTALAERMLREGVSDAEVASVLRASGAADKAIRVHLCVARKRVGRVVDGSRPRGRPAGYVWYGIVNWNPRTRLRAASDAFLGDLRAFERKPTSLALREGVPATIVPDTHSGIGSPAAQCAEG